MTEEPKTMKCGMCGQIVYKTRHGGWGCINRECADYFEPALRIDIKQSDIGRAPGVKLDAGKPPVFTEFLMQFPRAIRMITRVGAEGTKAPGHVRSGWKAVEQGYLRYSDAQARHLLDEAILGSEVHIVGEGGDITDPVEELIWQAATVAWNDLARLELLIRENRAAAERLDPRLAP